MSRLDTRLHGKRSVPQGAMPAVSARQQSLRGDPASQARLQPELVTRLQPELVTRLQPELVTRVATIYLKI